MASETWADAQFDMLEAAYSEVPIDAKARIAELESLVDGKTRWHKLFGTPERAARTLIDCNAFKQCVDCPVCHDEHGKTCEIPGDCAFVMRDYHKLLEWLRGESE